jgi:hypothetical protein
LALNQAFENVIHGLERIEEVTLFDREQLRYSRAEVESARVDVNREFFDKFEEIVEKDAEWAYEFCRAYDKKKTRLISTLRSRNARMPAGRRDCLLALYCFPTGTRTTSNVTTRSGLINREHASEERA